MRRIRRLLTFSNVVACLALFVALGGTVYAAGKISGKQVKVGSLPGNRIKPKTIAANRIKPKTLTLKQIKPKTLTGNQVKAHSLTGAQINQSTLNGVSAASLSGVQYAVATVSLTNDFERGTTATANCPTGTFVIGGGATVSNEARDGINDSGPTAPRTGWTATGFGFFGAGNTMTITAICVPIKTPVGSGPTTAPDYHPAG